MNAGDVPEDWAPLDIRESEDSQAIEKYKTPSEGIPPGLWPSLIDWVTRQTSTQRYGERYIAWPRVRSLERMLNKQLVASDDDITAFRHFVSTVQENKTHCLNVVDCLVRISNPNSSEVARLDYELLQGGSIYKIGVVASGTLGLVRRVEQAAEDAARRATQHDERAGQLLLKAWRLVYGLNPNPSDGYRQAVRAVEAAANPVVSPNDRSATLGKTIANLRNQAGQWELTLTHPLARGAGTNTLVAMMDLLWSSQHDRHVPYDEDTPLEVGQQEVETALHLAIVLVEWFGSGRVQPR